MEIQLLGQPLRGGADVGKNNSGEIKPSDGKDDSNPDETKPDGGEDDSNSGETRQNIDQQMILVPGRTYSILKTEVTQELYESVMGENPIGFKGEKNLPVELVSWYDAVYFCNKLSAKCGLTPVYAVDGEPDVGKWGYAPHKSEEIKGTVSQNENADGYRLPKVEEWRYAAKGGQKFKYSGSDNLNEVGWYRNNSGEKTHPVAQKKPNDYGLYDMSGNVEEWCWDSRPNDSRERYYCGGSWFYIADYCKVDYEGWCSAYGTGISLGFRIVRSTGK